MRRIPAIIAGALVLVSGACRGAGLQPTGRPTPDSVSIGYGSQPASDVTGAVQSLTPDDAQAQVGTMVDLLQGRVAGLEVLRLPGGQISLRLRGTASLVGNNEPLLVIDDQIISPEGVTSALMAVPPSDVDHIDVLKDAGSTAIYGSRGANGVILIYTKRGPR